MPLLRTALAAALVLAAPMARADDTRLLTILTAPEPQTQLMAMVLTAQAAAAGAAPQVLLCGPAADMALKAAPETATAAQPPKGMSPQGLMMKIAGMPGASVEVCAIYLPGRGEGPEVLLDGITVAAPDAMGRALIAPGTTVLSF